MWNLLSLDQSRHHPEHDGLFHEHRWAGFSCEGPRRRQASLDLGWWWWSLVRNDQWWWIGRCEFCQNVAVSTTGLVSLSSMSLSPWAPGARKNKTQCRLCKRLAGPIIPLSNLGTPLVWSYLARSAVVWPMAFWSLGCSHQPFACILSNYGDWQIKTGDASATLLLTSEKAVFCNNVIIEIEIDSFKTK